MSLPRDANRQCLVIIVGIHRAKIKEGEGDALYKHKASSHKTHNKKYFLKSTKKHA